jgi:hypothetical protein
MHGIGTKKLIIIIIIINAIRHKSVKPNHLIVGRESSVSIASGYELDGPGIESRWGGEIFLIRPDRP